MNRFDIINQIGDKYHIGNTETGEFIAGESSFVYPH